MTEHGICAKCKKSVGCPYADDRITGCKNFVLEPELKLTSKEWLRQCNTEQLAEWIISLCVTYFDRTDLSIVGAVKESLKINDHYDGHIQKDLLVEWLKQPHTKGDSE